MFGYSEKAMEEHFRSLKNVGEIESPDGVATVGNSVCADLMRFYIKVDKERLVDIKFKTFGCCLLVIDEALSEKGRIFPSGIISCGDIINAIAGRK